MTDPDTDSALLCTVGRKRVVVALTDAAGSLALATIRSFGAETVAGVSDALTRFQRDLALPQLPRRAAIAVAGLPRGDAISVTSTRWFVSRSGVAAMLGAPPLILNDFAAEAWGLYGADVRPLEMFAGSPGFSLRNAGQYAVLGMTSGLGAAVLVVGGTDQVSVLSTEAGHAAFAASTDEVAQLIADLFPRRASVAAEAVLSAAGLFLIYEHLAKRTGTVSRARNPEDVTRHMATDPIARQACELLCKAFWSHAKALVLTYGAWDGVVVTGPVAAALRPLLRRPDVQAPFATESKHQRSLSAVPLAYASIDNAELVGLAAALHHR